MPLPPGFAEISASPQQPSSSGGPPAGFTDISDKPDWGGVVKDALNEAKMGDGSKMRALMTDPVTQAKVLPYLATAGAQVTGIPGLPTVAMSGGRALSDAALASYGRSDAIPSIGQQAKEVGTTALLDIPQIPLRYILAKQGIANAEKSAGVVTNAANYPTAANVGDRLTDIEEGIKRGLPGPQSAKDAYEVAHYVSDNPRLMGKASGITVQGNRTRQAAEEALNNQIPARAPYAAEMARSMTIPNKVSGVLKGAPWWAKAELLYKALGGGR